MISITSNKNLLKTVSQNAFNTIPNTWQEVSKDYFDLYQKLLNQKKIVPKKNQTDLFFNNLFLIMFCCGGVIFKLTTFFFKEF